MADSDKMDIEMGTNFKRDGSDYDSNARAISLFEITDELEQRKIAPSQEIKITITGDLYTGGTPVSGFSKVTTANTVYNAYRSHKNWKNERRIADMLGMDNIPRHITFVGIDLL